MVQTQFRPEPDSLTNRFATVAREFVLPPGWWPVAFSAKVGRDPGAFVLAGRRLALYRDVSGTVRAVDDVCPHRRMPLSMGRVTEDGYLQCAYHGWCFDGATGQCAAIPHLREDEPVKANQGVASLATAETLADVVLEEGMSMQTAHTRGGYVHVWVGDGDPVDPPAVPAPGSSGRRGFAGTVKVRAPYDVLAEELLWNSGRVLGLPLLLGSGDELVRPKVSIDGDTVTVRRERLTLNLPRVQTFSAVNQGSTVTETSMNVVTGFASITAREPGGRVVSTVSIGLTPISPYLTALRWRAAVRATLRGRVGQATALHWLPARAARTAHASLDGRVGRHDEGIDAFRRSRAIRLEPATEFRPGGAL